MIGKPFVYFSEAIITPTRTVQLLHETVAHLGARPRLDLSSIWRQSALSVRSQASLYKSSGYKGEAYNKWVSGVLDQIVDVIEFPSAEASSKFKSLVGSQIGKPQNYYLTNSMKHVLHQFNLHDIKWGIIANESHLYPAVVKALGVSPSGPIVSASGPTMFKPLPKIWARAYERAPAASKHDIWFIGSSENPTDIMGANDLMRCVLVSPEVKESEPLSRHFRIRELQEVLPHLIDSNPALDLRFLDDCGDADNEVVMSSFIPRQEPTQEPTQKLRSNLVPPLKGKEQSVADYLSKQ